MAAAPAAPTAASAASLAAPVRSLAPAVPPASHWSTLRDAFERTRAATLALCEPLGIEDFGLQSMPDASPVKWHLAHTSWFYEAFVLGGHEPAYQCFHPAFHALFNSYYQSVGSPFARADRGKLSRPTVVEVLRYRTHVEAAVLRLLERAGEASHPTAATIASLVELGIAHEHQHQELLLTDLKHAFSLNPLRPAYRPGVARDHRTPQPMVFQRFTGGLTPIGHRGRDFAFDNETPRHRAFVEPFQLADRLVTNAEYLEFVRDGGYGNPALWLSDGWDLLRREGWSRPLYWSPDLAAEFSLTGERALEPAAPVSHLSFYEAEAYARWADARLPTEQEWEAAGSMLPVDGSFLERGLWHPAPPAAAPAHAPRPRLHQVYGDAWEWTRSSYAPYPGYRPPPGGLGEYNAKFMSGQMVLRGGSCATPAASMRATYRNFFPPCARWQFSGLRLARDG